MAGSRAEAQRGQRAAKAKEQSKTKDPTYQRYPQWKVDLFRAGIFERQQLRYGRIGERVRRAPGA